MNFSLTFSHAGEEVIILKAVLDAYDRVLAQVELDRAEAGDDLDLLLGLADVTDQAQAQRDRIARRWRRAVERMGLDEAQGVSGAEPPTMSAHGCAAVRSAVGPAPVSHQGCGTQLEPRFLSAPKSRNCHQGRWWVMLKLRRRRLTVSRQLRIMHIM